MTSIKYLPSNASHDDIIAEIEANGVVIVEDFLTQASLERFNGEIEGPLATRDPATACVNEAVALFHGPKTRHLTGVAGISDTFVHDVLLHPVYKAVGDHFLLPDCASYILNLGHVLDRGPGSDGQMIHRDQDIWPRRLSQCVKHRQFASLLALSDYTADMGATRVVPGSHLWPLDREPKPEEIAIAEMRPGSAAIYLGTTLHGAGPNSTSKSRRGMHVSFCLGWLRTEENSYLSTPLERVRHMPRRAQELLGFGVHDAIALGEGFLGALDNRNPADMLAAREL